MRQFIPQFLITEKLKIVLQSLAWTVCIRFGIRTSSMRFTVTGTHGSGDAHRHTMYRIPDTGTYEQRDLFVNTKRALVVTVVGILLMGSCLFFQ